MTIELRESELQNVMGISAEDFQLLELPQRRWVASRIYRMHTDTEDHFRADMMDLAHPNFSQFQILVGQ